MGDNYRRTEVERISLGFQPVNNVSFNIKNGVLASLRDRQFDGSAIRDPWGHLTSFYETCSICNIGGVTESHIKLKLFGF